MLFCNHITAQKVSFQLMYNTCIYCKLLMHSCKKHTEKHDFKETLEMWMCDIKLFVYLTIEYTISDNIFVFILKLRLSALQGYLIQADIFRMGQDIGRNPQTSRAYNFLNTKRNNMHN